MGKHDGTMPPGQIDARLRRMSSLYLGYSYSRNNFFPRPLGIEGLDVQVDPAGAVLGGIDCSSFESSVTVYTFSDLPWTLETWLMLQVGDAADPWSMLRVPELLRFGWALPVEDVGGGKLATPQLMPGRWHKTQAWQNDGSLGGSVSGGHQRMVRPMVDDPDRIEVYESTDRRSGVGPTVTWTNWSTLIDTYDCGIRAAVTGPR